MEYKLKRNQRGQLYSTDVLLSVMVFLFGLALVTSLTNQFDIQSSQLIDLEIKQSTNDHIMRTFFSTSGIPANWEYLTDRNDVQQIGLIGSGHEIDNQKWSAFIDWNNADYASLINAMGLLDQNFYITIIDSNRTTLSKAGTAPVDANSVTVVNIPSIYQQQPVLVTAQVFK
jgi:hypothetical protein